MSKLQGVARVLVVVAAVLLVLLIGSFLFAGAFVMTTINYVVATLANRSGMSVFLLRGLVIAATIPFFWAAARFTGSIVGFLKASSNPLTLYRNKYGITIVVYVALFYGALYWASQDAYAYKYCADTPEGISVSDSEGRDPVYGTEFQPCSIAQIEVLRNGKGKLAGPREIRIANAADYAWFDVAGRPRVWYEQEADGSYRFYDHAGVNPTTGHQLQPVDSSIVQQLRRQQSKREVTRRADDAKRQADDAKAKTVNDTQAIVAQAQSQFENGDYKTAIATCNDLLNKSPNPDCAEIRQHASVKLAQQLVDQGQSQLERGQLDEAMWSAEAAIKLDPTNRSAAKLKLLAAQLKPRTN